MEKKQTKTDIYQLFNEAKKANKLAKRMQNAYRRKRRDDAIQKLLDDPSRWSGLQ